MHLRLLSILLALATMAGSAVSAHAADVQWIWTNEGTPTESAPEGSRFFRRDFNLDRPAMDSIASATLELTADNAYRAWINGTLVGEGNEWHDVHSYDVRKLLVNGANVIAVEAINTDGPAGLLVKLTYTPKGKRKEAIVSDAAWKFVLKAPEGWQKTAFDDRTWTAAKVLGPVGSTGPWGQVNWAGVAKAPGKGRFTVPEGFRVENVAVNPKPGDAFSLVNMTFDNKGRLLASREGGPILVCTNPNAEGVFQTVRPYCEIVKNCQGMCWYKDSLLLVGDGPQGVGLYRCTDTTGADKIDHAVQLVRFRGGMGEHGPHAVRVGPDGSIYVIAGNHSQLYTPHLANTFPPKVELLASNSPLLRWPNGQQGPDQGQPGSTEDVLLKRLNDANGHAADIRAPGGTIWRCDANGGNLALVAAGFRNQFDIAFNPAGELFTFDSDMEWDEGLPWYRHVRVEHCPPGADYVWRTGAANTPNYYLDSLPPLYETGRGSPVGLEFYDHHKFGKEYRGCYFMADWSIGVIWAVHLEPNGATWKAKKVEKFAQGSPMNVTDLEVGPDGNLYFTMGGRGSQGGVFRIVREEGAGKPEPKPTDPALVDAWTVDQMEQPLSAWSKAVVEKMPADIAGVFERVANDPKAPAATRVRALTLLQLHPSTRPTRFQPMLEKLLRDPSPEVRAQAVFLFGVDGHSGSPGVLDNVVVRDADPTVRRRACEAMIRLGIEPPLDAIWPLLGDKDLFLVTAARLVLQRIETSKWVPRLVKESDDHIVRQGIVALCKTGKLAANIDAILPRLAACKTPADAQDWLDHIRTLQLVLFHDPKVNGPFRDLISGCYKAFPSDDWRINRELSILLVGAQLAGLTEQPVQGKIVAALMAEKDRAQQIHYFYCLRLLRTGWTPEEKAELAHWFNGTQSWSGGNSYVPFLVNIFRDLSLAFTAADMNRVVEEGDTQPFVTGTLLRIAPDTAALSPVALGNLYKKLTQVKSSDRAVADLKAAIITRLGKKSSPEVQAVLRTIADNDPSQREQVARGLASAPSAENIPYILAGLSSTNKILLVDVLDALKKSTFKPKPEDPAPLRAVLMAASRLDEKQRWQAIVLLRQWTNNKKFGAAEGDWKNELTSWGRYYNQTFPKEPALPDVAGTKKIESRYKFDELLAYLESEGKKSGDIDRGRVIFEKAQCIRCHKYGKVGEGVGPDLSAISKRFKRRDTLEAIVDPSKTISDQYRSTTFETKKGVTIFGLASAPQNGVITVLQQDGMKVDLKVTDIEDQFVSIISVMPEGLLEKLEKNEIADLFAYLESDPAK